MVKNLRTNPGDAGLIPRLGRFLQEEMATHSSIFAWKISWTEEPDGPQSRRGGVTKGSQLSDRTTQLDRKLCVT